MKQQVKIVIHHPIIMVVTKANQIQIYHQMRSAKDDDFAKELLNITDLTQL